MQAIANVASVLKPGTGQVLVRDYAEGDLAQQRLAGPSRSQRLSDNFYVRSDGTRAYYFDEASKQHLLCDLSGCFRQLQTALVRLLQLSLPY